MDYIISILPQMWEGTLETIRLFTITIVLSIPLGVLLALGRVSGLKPLRDAIGVYVADAAIIVCVLRPAVYTGRGHQAG